MTDLRTDLRTDQPCVQQKGSIRQDLRVLWNLLVHPVRGNTHQERLESFYSPQAQDYDSFRSRLLHGREELIRKLEFCDHPTWVDMGAGTGENVARAAQIHAIDSTAKVILVDLSQSLLDVAKKRLQSSKFASAQICHADVTALDLESESVDVVTFSYSLTMIPDWFAAIDTAFRILRPGGLIGVTDFYVSRKHPSNQRVQHGWLRRTFWSLWFACDNVFLNGDHLAMLERRFEPLFVNESLGKVPFVPLVKAPYYVYLGRKPVRPVDQEFKPAPCSAIHD